MMLHRHDFVKAVAEALASPCRVEPGDRLLIAVSGGADSVALLRALACLAPRNEWQLDLHIAHVHHHLREQADEDAAFVRDLAAELALPASQHEVYPAQACGNLEANARRVRYHALSAAAEQVGADAVAVAHHADDQLETMLMRLIRGAGLAGLSGMAPRRRLGTRAIIRPLLAIGRAEVLAFLRQAEQSWREDHTNREGSRWRARLRRDVLPVLHDLRPDAAVKANDAARHLQATRQVLNQSVHDAMTDVADEESGGGSLGRREASRLPAVVLGQVIRRLARRVGVESDKLGRRKIGPVVRAARDGRGEARTFELSADVQVVVERDVVRIERR